MGKLYVWFVRQSRVLILDSQGILLAHVLVSVRDEGKNLGTANLAFKLGTNEVFITAFGTDGPKFINFAGWPKV